MNEASTSTGKTRILFSPLDWGIGHASRSILLIKQLIQAGYEVIAATDGASYALLRSSFPTMKIIRLPFCRVRYSRHLPAIWKVFFSLPCILKSIRKEHNITAGIVEELGINLIVSDNRYGVYHPAVPSFLLIHQLQPRLPRQLSFLTSLFFRLYSKRLIKFNRIWVPDFADDPTLAGTLSHPSATMPESLKGKILYTGVLSRFMDPEYRKEYPVRKIFTVVVVLSGPEPQRSILEKILVRKLRKKPWQVLFIRGIPWKKQAKTVYGNIQLVSHLPPNLFYTYLKKAEYIISRAGYSTVMDLAAIGKSALLIPTPGQTEQEYLADHLAAGHYFVSMSQNDIRIQEAFEKLKKTRLFPIRQGKNPIEEIKREIA
ncbi:MAG: hypothetical protein J7K46_08075 [Bacteroidales bacterium]|nr:hypothetical protein [Bacteroidales bacterium]